MIAVQVSPLLKGQIRALAALFCLSTEYLGQRAATRRHLIAEVVHCGGLLGRGMFTGSREEAHLCKKYDSYFRAFK